MTRTVSLRAIAMAAASILLAAPAFSQAKGGSTPTPSTGTTGTGTGTPTPTTTTTRPTTNPTTTPNTTTQPTVNIPQPIFISGRVTMEDGTAPPETLVIERVCNGTPRAEGYTDSKGYFSIELGANRGMIPDASEIGAFNSGPTMPGAMSGNSTLNTAGDAMDRRLMGCDLQAKLAGYRSQSVPLTGRRAMDDPNVGVILLHRMGAQEEGKTVSMVSLQAPKDARKAYDKGMDALKKKKWADAQNSFEKAVELYPKYAVAWYELGRLRIAEDKLDIARGSFEEAIKADPKFVPPYVSLSVIELKAKRWRELADVTEKTVKLDPFDYPQAFFFNSVANYNMRNMDEAEKSALQAERLDTRRQYPGVSHLLGLILIDRRDWPGAAQRLKDYLKLDPTAADADTVRKQLNQVEAIQRQTASKDR